MTRNNRCLCYIYKLSYSLSCQADIINIDFSVSMGLTQQTCHNQITL